MTRPVDEAAWRRRLLERLPDEPTLVETRSLLLFRDGELWVDAHGEGFVARDAEEGLVAVHGPCPPELVREAIEGAVRGWTAVAPLDRAESVGAALRGWAAREALVFSLPAHHTPELKPPESAQLIEGDELGELDHLPRDLAREIELARGRGRPLVAARVDGRAVAFCYAYRQSESLWDLSIDTLAPYRRRGLAAACASRLIVLQRRRGREPVWGATVDNLPSLRLADRLDFQPAGRLMTWTLEE